MGNQSSQPQAAANSVTDAENVCSICLQSAQARGGIPLFSPGCCGKWFHQTCVDQLILSGNSLCPNCRAIFPTVALQLPQPPPLVPRTIPLTFGQGRSAASFSTLEEELIEVNPIATVQASNESVVPSIYFECLPERDALSLQECSDFYVNVSLKASVVESDNSSSRLPMDLVCVLDNSGSMDGLKITSVKEALSFIRSQLSPQDRLSLVIFNSQATVVHGLLKMNESNKLISQDRLQSVSASGGTDIFSGLQKAVTILADRKTKNEISCVFLLTDGQDSSRMTEKIALARNMRANGQSLFVFGFGNDHDADQLQNIAAAAEGPFTFVEADTMVVEAFGGALGGQQSMIGRDICLTLSPASTTTSRVNILQTYSGRYAHCIAPDGLSAQVKFANIFAGEQRDVLLKLTVPACSVPDDCFPLLRVSLQYQTMDGSAVRKGTEDPAGLCTVRRVGDASGAVVDVRVDAQKNRVSVAAAIEESIELASRHNFKEANQTLMSAKAKVVNSISNVSKDKMCTALVEEMDQAVSKISSSAVFNSRGGKAQMYEMSSAMGTQRCMYSKTATASNFSFQSNASKQLQEKSSLFKQTKK